MNTTEMKIRDGIKRSMSVSLLRPQDSFLSYSGILPVNFPDGTRILILPDAHIPAHHRRLFWAIMQFAAKFQPHVNISIGDWSDIFGLSRHPKPLRSIGSPQKELDESKRIWDELMYTTDALWGYIVLGNHEDRIYRFLQEFCPALGSVVMPHNREPLNFHSLMGFTPKDNTTFLYGVEERGGFEGGMIINDDMNLHHGTFVRPNPGASAQADMFRWQWNIGQGHTHRMGMSAVGGLRSYEFGHLTDRDHHFMTYAKKEFPNWAPGFAVGHVFGGKVHIQPVPVMPLLDENGRPRLSFTYDGELYQESDR